MSYIRWAICSATLSFSSKIKLTYSIAMSNRKAIPGSQGAGSGASVGHDDGGTHISVPNGQNISGDCNEYLLSKISCWRLCSSSCCHMQT